MSCLTLTQGRALPCKFGSGGIKAVSFAEWDPANPIVGVDGEVDALPISLTAAYRYQLKNAGNTYVEEIVSDAETRSTLYNGTLSLVLQKLDIETRNEIKMLAQGELTIFVETNNGDVFVVGAGFGNQLTGGSFVTGGAKADMQGSNLTFTNSEIEPYLTLSTDGKIAYSAIVVD